MTKIKKCVICKKEHNKRGKTCGEKECIRKCTVTDEFRRKISEGRKKYLKENPDKHPWKRSDKFKSEPCEYLKDRIRNEGIDFVEEFQPLEDRFFSIDIFFPSKGIGIEVNGNQHYNRDGTLKKYYQERHDLIESSGIKLIEIPHLNVYKFSLEEILCVSDGVTKYTNFKDKKKKEITKQQIQKRNAKMDELSQLVIERRILLDESRIDITKYGWVSKVAKLWDMYPQKVNAFVKSYYPDLDFFKEKLLPIADRSSKPCIVP